LRRLLWIPEASTALSRLPVINPATLKIIASPWINAAVKTKFVAEISQLKPERAYWALTYMLGGVLKMNRWAKRDPKSLAITSVTQLQTTYRRLHEEIGQQEMPTEKEFPEPPFEGTENIIPLRNRTMVTEEGREMKNCVADYSGRVQGGEVFLYRVLHPGRATAMVRKNMRGRSWYLAEISGPKNDPVGDDIVHAILMWLTAQNNVVLPPEQNT